MTHGVIIDGETYVAEIQARYLIPCSACDLKSINCAPLMPDGNLPCESANFREVISRYAMRRVIFIQPIQPTKEQSK